MTQARIASHYGLLPLTFEENRGQTDASVRFLSRGNGYGLFFTGNEAVLALRAPSPCARRQAMPDTPRRDRPDTHKLPGSGKGSVAESCGGHPAPVAGDVIRMQLKGALAEAKPVGVDPGEQTANYFLGNDPAKWHTRVTTYGQVRYAGVYPGVDLVYYGRQRQLEYDFVVAPGADPKPIRLNFAGATGVSVAANGDLAIQASHGAISFHKPVVYQETAAGRHAVDGAFAAMADGSVGFTLGAYDRTKTLVIDPTLSYSTYLGGTDDESIVAIAADAAGNSYVTGLTTSEDFPLTPGAYDSVNQATANTGQTTAFVSKMNPSGTALLYSTYIGGASFSGTYMNQGDYGHRIAVDAAGDAYVTGWTFSTNFPITSGAFQKADKAAANETACGFVTKLNASGTGLIYSTYLCGSDTANPDSVAIDGSGNAYISGDTFASDYPVTSGAFQTANKSASSGGWNQFVTKLNPSGSGLVYSTYLGGSGENGSYVGGHYVLFGVAVDSAGDAYVGGYAESTDFPVTTGAYQTTNHASGSYGTNLTLSKLNPAGSALLYSTYIGGSSEPGDYLEGLAIDASGAAYLTGYTFSKDFPVTKGAFQTAESAESGNSTGFALKMNPAGSALVYSTFVGGNVADNVLEPAVDASGDLYLTGDTESANFPVTSNAFQSSLAGSQNAFVAELNPAGTALLYSTYLGGNGSDEGFQLALGGNGGVYLAGQTSSSTFPVSKGAFETKYTSEQNTGFVTAFDFGAAVTTVGTTTAVTASANPQMAGSNVTFTATVAGDTGTAVPAGNVDFSIDLTDVGTVALSGGKASYSTATLAPGPHYVLASYAGNASFSASGGGLTEQINGVAATPVISPAGGTYTGAQTVTMTDATIGATIYYTVNGGIPAIYTGPIAVSSSETISAVAAAANNTQSATATATYTISGSTPDTLTIATVSAVTATQTQTITIAGQGFGTLAAYSGESSYIGIWDATEGNWSAGYGQDSVGLNVTSWTDKQIVLAGFTGSYGYNGWSLKAGDVLLLEVWNAQSGFGPAICQMIVGAGPTNCATAQAPGIISTVAGDGTSGYFGNNILATGAELNQPWGIALDSQGNYYIADAYNHRVRKVTSFGVVTTVAGNGTGGYSGDGGLATSAELNVPTSVAVDAAGNLYIADNENCRIRKVTASTGVIATFAGNGNCQFAGDGGAATSASLSIPYSVALDAAGNVYIADNYNYRIRKVNPSGVISTIAGNGKQGYSGDGGAATSAELNLPEAVSVDSAGNVYIADTYNQRIRKVTAAGTISTIAGTGTAGYSGDGGLATAAELYYPAGVLVDASGKIFVSDTFNNRVREIGTNGVIATAAGNGSGGFSGDGGFATLAQLSSPAAVAEDSLGNFYIADRSNARIRKVTYNTPVPAATPVFSLASGTYTSTQTVTIADATAGATIYYTTNGTAPTASSTKYTGAIAVSSTETLEAVAVATGYANSAVATASYTIAAPVPAVTLSASGSGFVYGAGGGTVTLTASANPAPGVADGYGWTIYDGTAALVTGALANASNGGFVYTTGVLTAGTHSFKAVYASATPANYPTGTSGTVAVTVSQASPKLTWATPAAVTAGTALSATQLDAAAAGVTGSSLAGTFSYSPALGTALTAVGNTTLTVTFTPTDAIDYTSAKASVTLTVNAAPVAATPVFSLAAGTYTSTQTVTIADATAGATIYYTTNGTAPTVSSTKYTGAIAVSSTETIEAIAIAAGYTNSPVATAAYTITPPAAAPVFSLGTGTYTGALSVTLTDATAGATIYYTTNGTTPTTASTKYSGAIAIPATAGLTETVEAIAVATNYSTSPVATAVYTIMPPAATPVISPTSGTYTAAQTVTIADATAGATIYYTTNGSVPTASSTKYTGPITVPATAGLTETIEAKAIATGYSLSSPAVAGYTMTPPASAPVFSLAAGTYTSTQTVTIADATAGATIYYTTNGSAPTASSTKYTGPIAVSSSETLEAIAIATGYSASPAATAKYTLNLTAAPPVFSVASGTYPVGQLVSLTDATAGAAIYYTTNGSAPTAASTPYAGPILVDAAETVSAIAVAGGYANSQPATATYAFAGWPSGLAAPATGVSTPDATLNAQVNTQGIAGSYWFAYGTSGSALTSVTPAATLTTANGPVPVSAALTNLKGKTTYYFQVVVTTAGGTATGAVLSFTTN